MDAPLKKPRETYHHPRPVKNVTPQMITKTPAVATNLAIIAPDEDDLDFETIQRDYAVNKRVKYATLRAHMEIAASMVASGATYEMAGARAGVSARQIRKYMTDADFRARVVELREELTSEVQGKILKRFSELVGDQNIKNLEVIDLTRIFDRVTGASQGGRSPMINTGDGGQDKYDQLLQQIVINVGKDQEPDFPPFQPDGLRLSGGDTPE